MSSTTCRPTACRRVMVQYYMVALASILAGTMSVLWFHWQGSLNQNLAFVVAIQLTLAMVGWLAVRRPMTTIHTIEHQLRRVSTGVVASPEVHPLADSSQLAQGWNRIAEQLLQHRALISLEARLTELHSSTDEKQWAQLFQALPDGVAVCDCDEAIVRANVRCFALLGLETTEELTGRRIHDVLNSHFSAAGQPPGSALNSLANRRIPTTIELRRGTQLVDGVLRAQRLPVIDESGAYQGSVWCFRDVTQTKIADESRNQFVFTATHELRTPLANIKAYADTLADAEDIDVADQKRFYNIISNEATRLARFVDELLNISQLESGAILPVRSEVDIERMIQETVENLRPQLRQKELNFETRLAPKLPTMVVDKDKLIAALVNLLGNAIKYTPEHGCVRLLVDQDDTSLSFHVEDTGIGISAEELPRISEKFFRSQDRRVQSMVGTGLGLAYAQEVARLHGGQLIIKSQLNKGSRFSLVIPLA